MDASGMSNLTEADPMAPQQLRIEHSINYSHDGVNEYGHGVAARTDDAH